MDKERVFPVIRQTVLDTTDPRRLAEFYRQLFGLQYRQGDEPPEPGQPDPRGQDWLILISPAGRAALAFQKVAELPEATWPDGPVPQQAHLDTTVPTVADLDVQHERAIALGPAAGGPLGRPAGAAAGLRRPGRAPVLHHRDEPRYLILGVRSARDCRAIT